jgi:hypothetical protein
MNATELLDKAIKAGYDYRAVYGKFPVRIGIHMTQLGLLPYHVVFPDPPPIELARLTEPSCASIPIDHHETRIEPAVGMDIYPDEVYLPVPGNGDLCVSGAFVAKLAKEFE